MVWAKKTIPLIFFSLLNSNFFSFTKTNFPFDRIWECGLWIGLWNWSVSLVFESHNLVVFYDSVDLGFSSNWTELSLFRLLFKELLYVLSWMSHRLKLYRQRQDMLVHTLSILFPSLIISVYAYSQCLFIFLLYLFLLICIPFLIILVNNIINYVWFSLYSNPSSFKA